MLNTTFTITQPKPFIILIDEFSKLLLHRKMKFVSAESITGGLIAGLCTERIGASQWFDGAYIVYNNEAKTRMLGVSPEQLASTGAVDEVVAAQMARGALERSGANLSVAVTGIAGPSTDEHHKPVGTVCMAWAYRHDIQGEVDVLMSRRFLFMGSRDSIRHQTVIIALEESLKLLKLQDE